VIRAVIEHDTKIDHGESGEISAGGGVTDSFFYGRNVIFRNGAAENIVDELELAAAWQGFHADLAVPVLTVAAGLLLVASLHVGFAANSLAVRNFGSLQDHFRVIALLKLRNDDFDMLLAGARDEEFLGLRIAEETQHAIFFHQFVYAGPELVFVRAALGFDGKRDGRLRQFHTGILNGS
jgi:hypothetical protein